MAHLGARQTEDLEVAGSSPACPILFAFFCSSRVESKTAPPCHVAFALVRNYILIEELLMPLTIPVDHVGVSILFQWNSIP